ncbi:outer membrane receptor for ferrienterochelin and colicins [Spirosomataceae bacterium TFI 002]|nr:outer membrane receptor for ferrienterochelin and colicins [Spirosomataceae bacterium TFI 002]
MKKRNTRLKISLLSSLMFFIVLKSNAQAISGVVLSSGEGVPFVSIAIKNGEGVLSDENGRFNLPLGREGEYWVYFTAVGFEKKAIKFNLKLNEVLETEIILVSNVSVLNEVVVTGTMKESTVSQSPAPIQVLHPTFFKSNPTPSVFEAIGMVNGVRPQINCNVCSTGDIHINGMEGPYTMVLIDGMPIVSSLSTVYGLMGIPNSMVERIEVMKGPASTLYGSEAVGGLINILTKNPSNSPRFSVDVSSNTYLENAVDASYAFSKNQIANLFTANYFGLNKRWDINADNFTDLPTIQRVSIFNKATLGKINPLNVALRYIDENRFGGEMQWSPENRGGNEVYGESIYTDRLEVLAKYSLPLANEKVNLQFSYNKHDQNSVYGDVSYTASQQVVFGQAVWDKVINDKNDALFGAAFRSTLYDDNTVATVTDENVNAPSLIFLPGVFVQNETTFNNRLKLLSGLRADFNSKHGFIFSPRLNLKYAMGNEATFRFSLGNGYRVVNVFSEDHAALTGARQILIEPNLLPEQSYNANLDFQKFWLRDNGYIEIQLNAFYTYFENKIIADYDVDPELIVYGNLNGYGVSRGLAANSSFSFKSETKLDLGITLVEVYNENNGVKADQIQTPKATSNYAISQRIPRWNLTIDFTGNLTSPMRLPTVPAYGDTRSEYSPWFSISNLQFRKKWTNGVELYCGVKNLFNYLPIDPIFRPDAPFSEEFDPSYNYAPLQSRKFFTGLRYNLR